MNTPPKQPDPTDTTPTPPGKAMRLARLAIALGLIVGVGVFGVLAVRDLASPSLGAAPDDDRLAGGSLPGDADPAGEPGDLLMGLASPSREDYIPIDHEPGGLPAYPDAQTLQPPYRQRETGGVVWEFGTYGAVQTLPAEVFAHYDRAARQVGLPLVDRGPTSANNPGGLKAVWADNSRSIELTVFALNDQTPRPVPPQRAIPPLTIVLKYSYPTTAR